MTARPAALRQAEGRPATRGQAPGERLLVRGAAGGIGNAAVQLGVAQEAEVTALARAANLKFVRELGAHYAVDHHSASPTELGLFDAVMDTVGSDSHAYRRLLKPGGRMVTIAFDQRRPLASLAYIAASAAHGGQRVRLFSGNPKRPLFDDLADEVAKGTVRAAVDTVFPLEETSAAHRALEAGGVQGKYVIQVG